MYREAMLYPDERAQVWRLFLACSPEICDNLNHSMQLVLMMCCRRDMLLPWVPRPRWRWYGRPARHLHQHAVVPIVVVSSLLKGIQDQSLTEVSTWSTPEISIALIHPMLKVKGCYPIMDLHNFISEFTNVTKHTKAISISCFIELADQTSVTSSGL